jgi:hypothetical protein
MDDIILSAEHELRATGAVSEATCRAFIAAGDEARRGFEPSFAFLGCPTSAALSDERPVSAPRRIAAIRLMMLRMGAHTSAPRWSSHVLDSAIEAALRPPGATIGDIVLALFALLAEVPELSDTLAHFIREVGIHIVGKQRRRYIVEDFSWLAAAIVEPAAEPNAAQSYLAAYTLPAALSAQCMEPILKALHSTRFEEEVKQNLGE